MAVDIVITVVEKMSDHLWIPIERQFGYLIHYKSNLESLGEELEKLENLRNGLRDATDAAKRNGELVLSAVENWMKKVDLFQEEVLKFLQSNLNLNTMCLNGWIPNFVTRYRIGKEASKKRVAAIKLQEDGKFNNISSVAPPPGISSMSSAEFVVYETRMVAFNMVMEALKDENINFIGIHGMGGIGKTTLVKEVGKEAKENKLFDEVVMAVVSQYVDIKKIQDQLADMLGMRLEDQSEIGRAGRLVARIRGVKRILIILDDVWARFDISAVGIPYGHEHHLGCKIVITTRRFDVCRTMCAEEKSTKIIPLDVLTETESWDLFRKNAGEVVDDLNFYNFAKEIVKECKGLPVAVVTVGRAMRGKRDQEEWQEAIMELSRSRPEKIEGVEENVVKCLKLSYNYLQDKEAKFLFLLCSLFPEDNNISIETLVRYAVGLEIIEDADSIQEVRRRVKTLIGKLKESCLLIAGDQYEEWTCRMHDVVRDVALSIGSEKYVVRAGLDLQEWPTKGISEHHIGVSLIENKIEEAPSSFSGKTNLRILLLQGNNNLLLPDLFFEGMKQLRVLDLSQKKYYSPDRTHTPPATYEYLTCLQTFVLEGHRLSITSFLGNIPAIVVLSLRHCQFTQNPTSLRCLTNLKLLDMSYCKGIVFEPNTMACLFQLEELYLEGMPHKWEFANDLHYLRFLKALTVDMINTEYLPDDFVFPSLEKFHICRNDPFRQSLKDYFSQNVLTLSSTRWQNRVKTLLKRTNTLEVYKFSGLRNIIPNLLCNNPADLDNIKYLELYDVDKLEYLINEEEWVVHHPQSLWNLQDLEIQLAKSFRGLCNGILPPSVISLSKLRNLKIHICESVLVAISPFNLLQRLKELESLDIYDCSSLKQLFDFNNEVEAKRSSSHLVLKLKLVTVGYCDAIRSLFHPVLAQSLHNLEALTIYSCSQIREIVGDEDEVVGTSNDTIVFHNLKSIRLMGLENLVGFCTGSFLCKFPSLVQLDVYDCPKMKTFAHSIYTPNLKSVKLGNVNINLQDVDLNNLLQTRSG